MTAAEAQLKALPIRTTIATALETLKSVDPADDSTREAALRARSVLEALRASLDDIPADLVHFALLAQTNALIVNMQTQLAAFLGNKHQTTFLQAMQYVDALLVDQGALALRSWVVRKRERVERAEAYKESVEQLVATFRSSLAELTERSGRLSERVETQGQQLEQQRQAQSARTAEFEAWFASSKQLSEAATSEFRERFDNQLAAQRSDVEARMKVIADQDEKDRGARNDNFHTIVAAMRIDATDLNTKLKAEAAEVVESVKEERAALSQSSTTAVEALLAKLKKKEEEVDILVGLVANKSMTGTYQKVADEAAQSASSFTNGAIFLMLVAVVGTVVLTVYTLSSSTGWFPVLFRTTLFVAGLVPALYCAREASAHRAVERRARQLQLELAALGPFLAPLLPEKQAELRAALTEKFFGRVTEEEKAPTPKEIKDYLEPVAGIARDLAKLRDPKN